MLCFFSCHGAAYCYIKQKKAMNLSCLSTLLLLLCITVIGGLCLHAKSSFISTHLLPTRLKCYQHQHWPTIFTDEAIVLSICRLYGVRAIYEQGPVSSLETWIQRGSCHEWWATQTTAEQGTIVCFRPAGTVRNTQGVWRTWSIVWHITPKNQPLLRQALQTLTARLQHTLATAT